MSETPKAAPLLSAEEVAEKLAKTLNRASDIASNFEPEKVKGYAAHVGGVPIMVYQCPCGMVPPAGLSHFKEGEHDKYWCRACEKLYRVVQEG